MKKRRFFWEEPSRALARQPACLIQLHRARQVRALGSDFFEGVVMKRGNAPYPVQLRSDTEECRAWAKHRFVN